MQPKDRSGRQSLEGQWSVTEKLTVSLLNFTLYSAHAEKKTPMILHQGCLTFLPSTFLHPSSLPSLQYVILLPNPFADRYISLC